jgi:DHA1 family bicyclomycin/chloramphenicol resistance-like MFS transporter
VSAPSAPSAAAAVLPDDEQLPTALQRLAAPELIALLAFSMALTALGIDLMLPAFGQIRATFGLASDSNATAGLVTTYFIGLAVGQLGFGIIADSFGRRRALYIGYVIYGIGAVAALLAPTFGMLLGARVLWGVGAAGGRVVTLAVIRDTWSGDKMSRAMSFVMAVFITVPILSPALGTLIIAVGHWRWTFGFCAVAAAAVSLWAMRLPETLAIEDRRELSFARLAEAGRFVFADRQTVLSGLAITSLYAVFTSWIASSELIITDVFNRGAQFPVIFGGLAVMLGLGMLLNARVVERFGTRRVTGVAMTGYVVATAVLLAVVLTSDGRPAFWAFIPVLGVILGAHALLVPNVNSLAMEHMGAVAGTASAIVGAMQVAGGALLGRLIDGAFDGSLTPMAIGFAFYGVMAAVLLRFALRAPTSVSA